ncbi:MAG TPA: PaaI family thioesterase [Gammaproteobacteria bacterium]|nr:PaaI family thioesterase [Gammaproteobacteria bacterium]
MSGLAERIEAIRRAGDPQALVDMVPYARLLGVVFREVDGLPTFSLAFRDGNIGNPYLPALHGGAIGGFMENAAVLHLIWTGESRHVPRVVDFSIDYLRPGRPETVIARCDVWRQGSRVANVGIRAWQEDETRVIATARAHFLVGE